MPRTIFKVSASFENPKLVATVHGVRVRLGLERAGSTEPTKRTGRGRSLLALGSASGGQRLLSAVSTWASIDRPIKKRRHPSFVVLGSARARGRVSTGAWGRPVPSSPAGSPVHGVVAH